MSRLYGLADRYMTHQVKKDAMCCYLKSGGRMAVRVQVPPPAPFYLTPPQICPTGADIRQRRLLGSGP